MKRLLNKYLLAPALAMVCAFSSLASSHREAPLIANDPQADNTDLYAFRSPKDSNKIIIVADYIPFQLPNGGPNYYSFGPNIRYEIHIKNNAATTGDDITYRFTFATANEDPSTFFNIRLGQQNQKNTYTCERMIGNSGVFTTIVSNGKVPPANIGPRSIENPVVGLGAPNYDSLMNRAIMSASTGERIYAGPADDPFFVDLGGAFDLGGFRQPGRDGVAKYNVHTIVIEVPIATLQKTGLPVTAASSILDPNFVIGVWASASRPQVTTLNPGFEHGTSGSWVQVSRLGMPLTNEVIIPVGQKDAWNSYAPGSAADQTYLPYFSNPELALYVDTSSNGYGKAVPGLSNSLHIQSASLPYFALGPFDFRNGKKGLYTLKGNPALTGTALDPATFGNVLLPNASSPRAADILPIFLTGVPNLAPYQLATGKTGGNPLTAGKPFINNFLPTLSDMLRLNMAVPVTPRNSPDFSSLGILYAAVLGLTDARFNGSTMMQNIPNMDGFPNGRRLEDDVTTIELQAIGGVALAAIGLWYDDYNGTGSPVTAQLGRTLAFNAGVTKNDTTFKTSFPFVQQPWRGFRGEGYVGPDGCIAYSATITGGPAIDNCHDNTIYVGYGPQSVTLTTSVSGSTGPYTYLWSNGATTASITVSPTAGTDYTVAVKDGNGCRSNASNVLHVSVIDVRCGKNNDKVSVYHSAGNSGAQILCISAGAVANHIAHGDCLGDGSNASAKNTAGSAHNNLEQGGISVFPNPASGKISIALKDIGSAYLSYQITDISGRVIYTQPISGGVFADVMMLDISAFAPGVYIIRAVTEAGSAVGRFTVK
jgi:hypothetical protein